MIRGGMEKGKVGFVPVLRAYKTELAPNRCQRTLLLKGAGAARVAYNWGLREKEAAHGRGEKPPSAIDLHKKLVVLKNLPKDQGGFPWMYEVSKWAPQEALRNLDVAYKNFFRRCKQGGSGARGFPHFKSRKNGVGSFTLEGPIIHAHAASIQLPRIGRVKLKERGYIPVGAKVQKVTVSEHAGRWFISVLVATEAPPVALSPGTEILGVDVGIKHLAMLSDGTVFENPRALRTSEVRLKHLQRLVSRKRKGSAKLPKRVKRVFRVEVERFCREELGSVYWQFRNRTLALAQANRIVTWLLERPSRCELKDPAKLFADRCAALGGGK